MVSGILGHEECIGLGMWNRVLFVWLCLLFGSVYLPVYLFRHGPYSWEGRWCDSDVGMKENWQDFVEKQETKLSA